ncbi:hypothetical protein ACH5RR_040569 [Cinchona calisaya]|uniref:Uncharacterized protein n=1 Tax=Cinchona calisaya TaxID=153742 RepID=A0ABD2XW94_9GENT
MEEVEKFRRAMDGIEEEVKTIALDAYIDLPYAKNPTVLMVPYLPLMAIIIKMIMKLLHQNGVIHFCPSGCFRDQLFDEILRSEAVRRKGRERKRKVVESGLLINGNLESDPVKDKSECLQKLRVHGSKPEGFVDVQDSDMGRDVATNATVELEEFGLAIDEIQEAVQTAVVDVNKNLHLFEEPNHDYSTISGTKSHSHKDTMKQ